MRRWRLGDGVPTRAHGQSHTEQNMGIDGAVDRAAMHSVHSVHNVPDVHKHKTSLNGGRGDV